MPEEPEPIEVETEVVSTPGKIPKGTVENFKTMQRALVNGHVALVSTFRKGSKDQVTLICAMSANDDGTVTPVPLAEMIETDPYETYEDPTI